MAPFSGMVRDVPIHRGDVLTGHGDSIDPLDVQHRRKVPPCPASTTGQTGQVQGRATRWPTSLDMPRAFHDTRLLHGVGHVGPVARRPCLPPNKPRGVDRGVKDDARLGQRLCHPRGNVARRRAKPRFGLVSKRCCVCFQRSLHRRHQAFLVLRPSAPSAMGAAVAAEREQFAACCREVDQRIPCLRVTQLVLDDKHRDRMARPFHPCLETVQARQPGCAGLTRRAESVRVPASGGMSLLPRSVVGIVGVHGQPRAAHASSPPTWMRWRW